MNESGERSYGAERPAHGSSRPLALAFYLPQFHRVPENDAWWGSGFTEWSNVVRARPLWEGHSQPHYPGELGFYDLRVPEVRAHQAALARGYGVDGFCYYHYWFEGRRLLQRPFEEVLESGEPDFPFCLAWANENWTRIWDAGDSDLLQAQVYNDEDDRRHIEYLLGVFSDPRYVRVGGRPLLLIYRVQAMPDPRRTFAMWRDRARREGIDDLYLVKFDTHSNFDDPARFGCDAAAEFVPHGVGELVPPTSRPGCVPGNAVFEYKDVATAYVERDTPPWTRYPCVATGFDNSPRRRDGEVLALLDNDPEIYEWWLRKAVERARAEDPRNPIVFINAWNEWAEGAHLEPDARFGRAFLLATARVLGVPSPSRNSDAAGATEPRSFADLYLSLYEDFVELQHVHTAHLASFERRLRSLELEHEHELSTMRDRMEKLRVWADALRTDVERARTTSTEQTQPSGMT